MAKGRKKIIIESTIINDSQEISKELVAHIDKNKATLSIKEKAIEVFNPIFSQLKTWEEKINEIDIKDGTDATAIEMAGRARKDLKAFRVSMTKDVKKEIEAIKENMLPFLEKIEAWKTISDFTESMIKRLEDLAEEKEKFVQNFMIEERKRKVAERGQVITDKKLNAFFPPMIDLGVITQEEFEKFIEQAQKLKNLDDQEKEKEAAEAAKEARARETALRTTTREKELLAEGFKEEEDTFVYEEDVIILKKDIQEMEEEDYVIHTQEIFKEVFQIRKKKKEEQDAIDAQKRAEEERQTLILKTKEYFVNKGMKFDEGFNEYRFPDSDIVILASEIEDENATRESLRELMISTSKKIEKIIEDRRIAKEAEEAKAKEKTEADRQKIAQRIIGLKECTVDKQQLIHIQKTIKEDVKVILMSLDALGAMTDKEYKDYAKDHDLKIKNQKAEIEKHFKQEEEKLEAERKAKQGDFDKLKEYADKIHTIAKNLNEESFTKDEVKVFSNKIYNRLFDIVEAIDKYTK